MDRQPTGGVSRQPTGGFNRQPTTGSGRFGPATPDEAPQTGGFMDRQPTGGVSRQPTAGSSSYAMAPHILDSGASRSPSFANRNAPVLVKNGTASGTSMCASESARPQRLAPKISPPPGSPRSTSRANLLGSLLSEESQRAMPSR